MRCRGLLVALKSPRCMSSRLQMDLPTASSSLKGNECMKKIQMQNTNPAHMVPDALESVNNVIYNITDVYSGQVRRTQIFGPLIRARL